MIIACQCWYTPLRVSVCSVLEPGRTLTLAEKGGAGAEVITAAPGFRLVGTMNPGGDYGKKELSPALSNRFTQIWVPAIEDQAELAAIIQSRITGTETFTCALLAMLWSLLVCDLYWVQVEIRDYCAFCMS